MSYSLDQTFAALGDPTRRMIVETLSAGETRLSDLAEPFEMSQTAVSKHVRILSDAGLVEVEKRGRTRYCRLEAAPMKAANEWLSDYQKFWTNQFDNLGSFLVTKGDDE
ncbi:MAG: metalloregulator ArsR/SmtB family transcription factor [Pseudomonadota bacterium]